MTHAAHQDGPLRTVLIPMSVPERAQERLRGEFPDIRFIVPGSDQSGRYIETPDEPSEAELQATDAIIAWSVPPEMLAAAPRLRWIHSSGAGVNSYDLRAIAERGIVLTNSSGVAAPNMAEHVLAMMLAMARRIPRLVDAQRAREWRDHETHREVAELLGETLLVVGTGDIGCAVAVRAAAFGMQVHGVRRRAEGSMPECFWSIRAIDALKDALAEADHVVVTLPETASTRRLFDAAALEAMKPGAVLYNVGRGAVIDTGALVDALQSGHLCGAGLDVTDPEPLPADSPLWAMDNVLITAHTSGSTPRYWDRLVELIAENIRRYQNGDVLRNVVDLQAGY